jgi:hypothetical protein
MSAAYVIEAYNQAAGIVTADDRDFSFFSSERAFDSLKGRHFRSASPRRPRPCRATAISGPDGASRRLLQNAATRSSARMGRGSSHSHLHGSTRIVK